MTFPTTLQLFTLFHTPACHAHICIEIYYRHIISKHRDVRNGIQYSVLLVFTARRYATVVYAVVVCPSVCLPQAGIVSKPLNTESRKQRHTIAHGI